MADTDDRRFDPSESDANRTRMQGGGVGAREMDQQRDPDRFQTATNPEQRSFGGDLDDGEAGSADRPSQADFGDTDIAAKDAPSGGATTDRSVGRLNDVEGDLGAGTPANVDIHKLGQDDRPEQDWGDPADEGATFSSNHARRGDGDLIGQGSKTRAATKDMISRRG